MMAAVAHAGDTSSSHEEIEQEDQKDGFCKKALLGFRCRMEDAILGNYLLGRWNAEEGLREISLWGVPLLPSKGSECTNVVLMKFLRATDFKVVDAFEMLRKTLIWRRKFGAGRILDEGSSDGPESAAALSSEDIRDRQGRPLCFDVYGDLEDDSPCDKTLGFEERCERLLQSRIRSIEKGIRKINFSPAETNSLILITDLSNLRGGAMTKEARAVSKKSMVVIQEYYPELIHRHMIINVPFWYYAFHAVASRFMPQRTRSKFVFARPQRVTQTLLRPIAPENIPIQYGGLWREKEEEFSPVDEVSEMAVRGGDTETIQIATPEAGVTAVWDVAVVGSKVGYREEFVPDDECSYTILLKEEKKLISKSVRNSFYIGEPGRIVITINNGSFRRKRVMYRCRTKPTVPMYVFSKRS